jgi:serine protease Do
MSVVVAGIGVYEHYRPSESVPDMVAVAAAASGSPASTLPVNAAVTVGQPVGQPLPMGSLATDAVRLIGATQSIPGGPDKSFNAAALRIRPSVVSIRAALGPPTAGQALVERIGSGIVVGSGTHIITCRHVVDGARSIIVTPFESSRPPRVAQLVASDNDLALLQLVDGPALPPASFSDSSGVEVGDWVLAVGHPFGLGLTVTAGIVGRRHGTLAVPGGQQYASLLQTDAPINEGSSGGPLVDLAGDVVGLNTAIYAPTGVFSGAGFAIPSNQVAAFVTRTLGPAAVAVSNRAAAPPRPWWGFALAEATAAPAGVIVQGVVAGGPAARAGLAAGDRITTIAGQNIGDLAVMHRIQGGLQIGDWVPVQVWRNGQVLNMSVQIGNDSGLG